MKKLFTLLLVCFTLSAFSQPFQDYTINVAATSNGLTVPSGFVIEAGPFDIKGFGADSIDVTIQICAKSGVNPVAVIDQMVAQGFPNIKTYRRLYSGTTSLNNLLSELETDLTAAFGSGNWTKD